MKKIKRSIILALMSSTAVANVSGPYYVTGLIKSFDEKWVVMETKNYHYEIPREYVHQRPLNNDQFGHLKLKRLN
jgi:hypothetical protein